MTLLQIINEYRKHEFTPLEMKQEVKRFQSLPKEEQAKTLFKAAFDALELGNVAESNCYYSLAVDIQNTIKTCNTWEIVNHAGQVIASRTYQSSKSINQLRRLASNYWVAADLPYHGLHVEYK